MQNSIILHMRLLLEQFLHRHKTNLDKFLRLELVWGALIIAFLLIDTPNLYAQCSCGGPPLLSSLESPSTAAGVWQFGLTTEYSSVSDFVTFKTQLDDDVRDRTVASGLLQVDYGLTDRITISGLVSFLQQERTTFAEFSGQSEFLRTSGVGDAMLLVKYSLLNPTALSRSQLALGGGVRSPLGRSRLLNNNQTLIAATMQPGTGAWDGILWGSATSILDRRRGVNVFASATYRITSSNSSFFGDGIGGYRFGNEFLTTFGAGIRQSSRLDYTAGLRYRSTRIDQSLDFPADNSGGKWLNFSPGVNFKLTDVVALRGSGQIPLWRELRGTQYTTSYSLSFSIFYTLKPKSASADNSNIKGFN